MKRAGFTMIELIFVIVILGILSAVALPKFIGVSEQAKAGKCKGFIGTMNRTVLPALWSDAMLAGTTPAAAADFNATAIDAQIDVPTECGSSTTIAAALAGTAQTLTLGAQTYTIDLNNTISVNASPVLNFR